VNAESGRNFLDPNFVSINNTDILTRFARTTIAQRRLVSAFGQAQLGYDNWAFVTVTGRNDWTSTIPVERNSFFYPSIQSSFIFSDAFPAIGKIAVADIALQDVLRVLEPIWSDKTETASKLRQKIEGTLSWATVKGYRSGDNPAAWRGNLKHVLAAPNKVAPTENYPSLQLDDAARWWEALQAREGMGAAALAFQAMTATRSGAVRYATWDEVDLERGLWTIQPGRQSSKIPHGDDARTVPLTPAMIAHLKGLPRLKGCNYVFWAPRGGALSDATIAKAMRALHDADVDAGGEGFVDVRSGEAAVPHGLRASFRTWVSERTTFDGDLAEVALFHKIGNKTTQSYNRADMIEKRRRMMVAWGEFLAGAKGGNVVKLAGAR
jgi:integrase